MVFCQKVIESIMDEETESAIFKIVDNDESGNDVIYLQINNGSEELLEQESQPFEIVALDNDQYFYIHVDNEDTIQTVDVDGTIVNNTATVTEQIGIQENSEVQNGTVIQVVDSADMVLLKNEVTTNKKQYQCLYTGCDKVYSSSQHLTVHMRNHVNSKPYSCTFKDCDKKFATNYALTSHWRIHTGEKPYICENCTKSFKTSGDLLKHVRIHTGERPFCCPIEGCGRSFTTSNIRKVHIRSHTGERPYVCDYPNCGKAFASSTNYKNHSRIHSGEKPYVCNVQGCHRKFTEYSSLYKHQAVHQVSKPVDCEYCHLKFKSENTLNIHRKCKHGILVSPLGIQLLDIDSLEVKYAGNKK